MRLSGDTNELRCPERAQIHRRVARFPATQEALDRRMEHDVVELDTVEQPVASHRRILRRDSGERTPREIAGEDDVHDVLDCEGPLRRDRVDEGDRPLDRDLVLDADLLVKLAVERVGETLAGVHASARQQPVLAAARLLVAAEQDPVLPPQQRRDPDPRFGAHQTADEPKPRTPRSLSGSSSTSTGSMPGTGTTTSCAMRMPGSTTNGSRRSVLSRTIFSSPR